jgi:hypothetical protein
VFSLYDYYQKQLEENNNEAVVATTALARLPSHIQYSVHDVAHLFRKLLHGLPGGLLGSPAIFQALYNIHRFVYPDPSLDDSMTRKVKPRMIALALSSINLHFRIALVCAVFGLLRAVSLASEQEKVSKVKDPHEMFTQMKEDALGIAFGPLLLGDKSDHILTEDLEDRGGLLVLPAVDPAAHYTSKRGKGRNKIDLGYSKKQLEKTKRAATVCQMLIENWEDISYQMKRINTLGVTAKAYDLPAAQSRTEFKYSAEEGGTVRKYSVRGERSQRNTIRSSRAPIYDELALGSHPNGTISKSHQSEGYIPKFKLQSPIGPMEDLLKFSSCTSFGDDDSDHHRDVSGSTSGSLTNFTSPPAQQGTGMTPIAELTPVRPMRSLDYEEPRSSPNWRIISPEEMEEPQTPVRRLDFTYRNPIMGETSPVSSMHEGTRSSGESTPTASPPLDIAARAAIRFQRDPITSSPLGYDDLVSEEPKSLSAPPELDISTMDISALTERALSPVPQMPDSVDDPLADQIADQRSITPKPLSFRKKGRDSSFSIFEDQPGGQLSKPRLDESPILTFTKPNSKVEIVLDTKGTQRTPARTAPDSPTRPQSIPLQPATPNRRPRPSTMESDFDDRFSFITTGETPSPGKQLRTNTALYAEIRRLQRLVDAKIEEANQTRRELELAKNMANAGTLSHLVRETQEELKVWRNRAEWAEKQLLERGLAANRRRVESQRYSIE